MIKLISIVIFVAFGLSDLAAGDMSSCGDQSNCFEWSATEEIATTCKRDGSCQCQFRMCVLYNQNKLGCAMTMGEAPDKTCVTNDNICQPPLSTSVEYQNYSTGSYQCQVVPPGGAAEFIFQDGPGCNAVGGGVAEAAIPVYNSLRTSTSCCPNYNPLKSCGGNFVPGKECLWTYTAPEFCSTYRSWVCGDPHFQTWGGENYDFHGVCDLVLMENRDFRDGLDMNIHIRTKEMKEKFSYISNAVIQIGEDTLEVAAGGDGSKGEYWINGIAGKEITVVLEKDFYLPENLSGYPIIYRRPNEKSAEFEVYLGGHDTITLKTWKEFVRVGMNGARSNFKYSRGLMGTIDGLKIARDNATIIEDLNEFGMEWQVLSSEQKLFHHLEGPQHPQQCIIPSAISMRRRLRESNISQEQAELACSRVTQEERDICVFDVMVTGDLESVSAY